MSKLTKLQRSARTRRGNLTRKYRRYFFHRYPRTAWIVYDILTGTSNDRICYYNDISLNTLRTVKSNLARRNYYSWLARACRF